MLDSRDRGVYVSAVIGYAVDPEDKAVRVERVFGDGSTKQLTLSKSEATEVAQDLQSLLEIIG